ncbi:UNVERIFIED_CONTAM: hypothetical protein PYX00_005143 [Menopon gallinae]|uniref:RPA-interacting protein C-terminal domain-containing protein n=1 Tax=Menopon gallinae TaxID=328185 RepID=A0AAW2HQT5_9NEOP
MQCWQSGTMEEFYNMAESLVISPVTYRIKAKNAYLRMKNCSPKFRTVLRQKYRERVQTSRSQLLDKFRHIEDEEIRNGAHDSVDIEFTPRKHCMIEELLQYNEDFNIDDELLVEDSMEEELTQFENWLLQEYESLWNEEKYNEVIITCPLCCVGHFKTVNVHKLIYCTKCGSLFKTERSALKIQNDIFSEVDSHNSQCHADPAFVKVPCDGTYDNLCIVCDICSYMQVII